MLAYLVSAFETCGDDFGNNIHTVLRFLYHVVHFGERSRFADCGILDGELQLLHASRDLVDVIQQLLLQRTARNLSQHKVNIMNN